MSAPPQSEKQEGRGRKEAERGRDEVIPGECSCPPSSLGKSQGILLFLRLSAGQSLPGPMSTLCHTLPPQTHSLLLPQGFLLNILVGWGCGGVLSAIQQPGGLRLPTCAGSFTSICSAQDRGATCRAEWARMGGSMESCLPRTGPGLRGPGKVLPGWRAGRCLSRHASIHC